MASEVAALLGVAFLLGMFHCLEGDHLAAILAVLTKSGPRFRGVIVGTIWGVGHAATVVAIGAVLWVGESQLTGGAETGFELAAGLMLIALGGWRLAQAVRGIHLHPHRHDDSPPPKAGRKRHRHFHLHLPFGLHGVHRHSHLPFYIGMLHGLAGSASVMILAPPLLLDSLPHYLIFLLAFGIGTIVGMAALAQVIAGGLAPTLGRHGWGRWAAGVAGVAGLVIGTIWSWRATMDWI